MNKILYSILITILTVSCDSGPSHYRVDISLSHKDTDSAYIYIYEQEYGALRLYDKGAVNNGRISFTGEISEPKIAFLKLNKDTVPYYFILDSNPVSISFDNNKFILEGIGDNAQYFRYLLIRQNIGNVKKSLWKKYQIHVRDSLLTDSIENALKLYNDMLTDSLEDITVDFIKANKLGGEIVWRQFGNSLPDNKLDNLKR